MLLLLVAPAAGSEAVAVDGGLLELGERVYRNGLLGSGKPVEAFVSGDVPVDGTQFTCVSCHLRSGMGSSEGQQIAPMVTGAALYRPRESGPKPRPAYTDESLAQAMLGAVDPGGNLIETPMPQYDIPEREMEALIAYMKSLSAEISPGVSEDSLHFGTVVTDGVDPAPMLEVLQTFFREKNNDRRNPEGRHRAGPFYRQNVDQAYRKWVLHVYRLGGGSESWPAQLEAHYARQPVFAMLSGMASGSWRPIHEFCERRGIPCLLPNTDLPVVDDDDFYTLYFSQGLALEARTVAEHIRRESNDATVLQLYRTDEAGTAASRALRSALAGGARLIDRQLRDGRLRAEELAQVIDRTAADVVVLWLPGDDVFRLQPWPAGPETDGDGPQFYISSSMLGARLALIPETVRSGSFIVHPFSLDEEFESAFRRTSVWLENRGIEIRDPRMQAQTYFACMLAGEALMHVKFDFFYRDFFLEGIDHMSSVAGFCASHPSPSFGPGQRYISKGSYILSPTASEARDAGSTATWIVPGGRWTAPDRAAKTTADSQTVTPDREP